MPVLTIGIAGRKGHGKDLLASYLNFIHGYERHAFADALKVEIALKLGISLEELERDKEIHRPLLVSHGNRMRGIDPNYWIDKVPLSDRGYNRITISDVRYPNEVQAVRRAGGKVVFVSIVGKSLIDDNPETNAAEQLMPGQCDLVLPHDGRTPLAMHCCFATYCRFLLDLPIADENDLKKWYEWVIEQNALKKSLPLLNKGKPDAST